MYVYVGVRCFSFGDITDWVTEIVHKAWEYQTMNKNDYVICRRSPMNNTYIQRLREITINTFKTETIIKKGSWASKNSARHRL